MSAPASGVYTGVVVHHRRRPRSHRLRYRVFMLLIDLDEAPALFDRLRLLRAGRFGLMSFFAGDHGDGSSRPLREQVEQRLAQSGIVAGGAIRLLCMPRIFGYGFNPLSLYFCHRPDGALAAILYEVSNTFGDRHTYVAACPDPHGVVRQTAAKRMHVSPFMDMDQRYRFVVRPPCETIAVEIGVDDAEGEILSASFKGRRRPLSDPELAVAWAAHPLLTFKVIAGIHWEALRIWLKGVGYRPRPKRPPAPASLGAPASAD